MNPDNRHLAPGIVVREPLLPEPVEIIITIPMGDSLKIIGGAAHRTGPRPDPEPSPTRTTHGFSE